VRLFVAVWPPPAVVRAVEVALATVRSASSPAAGSQGAPSPRDADLRWTASTRWHVTLRFLGEAGLDEAGPAFRSVGRSVPGPVEAVVGPATGSFGRRVLHVPVAGLDGLAAAVLAATAPVGCPPDDRPFAGHLTLARARARGGVDLSAWCGLPVSGSWTVGELTLVASATGAEGSRYDLVDRLPLAWSDEGPCSNTRSQLH